MRLEARERSSHERSTASWPLGELGLSRRSVFDSADSARVDEVAEAGSDSSDVSNVPRVAVLGLARSGLAAAKLLLARGCQVELWDLHRPDDEILNEQLDERVRDGGCLFLGPHQSSWLDRIDLLVKSPGVDPRIPFIVTAKKMGVPIVGELELASLAAEGPIVALTGTNGKSTTTAWVGHMLTTGGKPAEVVGNIGRPFSEGVLASSDATFVTEVSSFQLEDISTFRPQVATWLNFSPDHLDRHGRLEDYRAAKMRLFENQCDGDIAVLGVDPLFDDPGFDALPSGTRCLRVRQQDRGEEGAFLRDGKISLRFSGEEIGLPESREIALPGPHNLANAMAAATTAYAAGADPGAIATSLIEFPGLSHRLENVGSIRGVVCINDSKATNIDSLAVALASYSGPVHLIAGGVGKGQDFSSLQNLIESKTASVYLIGEVAEELSRAWSAAKPRSFSSLEAALSAALQEAAGEGTILLSPGCASFDMFRDYEHRGDTFRTLVARYTEEQGA